ncbi:MAG: phosphopantetheine-binding protein [Planctomycetaceae bacterium]|nr:phosphopantetheine-binding protein [Planctomycetaceae bacterium]
MTTTIGKIVYFDATQIRREKMRNNAVKTIASVPAPQIAIPEIIPESNPAPILATAVELITASTEPAVASVPSTEELQTYLVNFVVEQTGYPDDFVTLDADLEGDLGVDSIKKAQLLGELNEMFHFAEVNAAENSRTSLDDFSTLRHILDFMSKRLGVNAASSTTPVTTPTTAPSNTATPQMVGVAQTASITAATSVTNKIANAPSTEELQTYLVNFVVEQTGYPEDFVTLDADLEGDLGVDSIKKAQLLGELNEMFHFAEVNATENSGTSLDDFSTLRHILDFMSKRLGAPSETSENQLPFSAAQNENNEKNKTLKNFLVNFVIEQTGYPEDFVTLDADLESDLGVDSIKKAQLFGELIEVVDVVPVEHLTLDDFKTLGDIYHFVITHETR